MGHGPAAVSPELEEVLTAHLSEMVRGFRRVAMIVGSATAMLQLKRLLARARREQRIELFSRESDAMEWLRERTSVVTG